MKKIITTTITTLTLTFTCAAFTTPAYADEPKPPSETTTTNSGKPDTNTATTHTSKEENNVSVNQQHFDVLVAQMEQTTTQITQVETSLSELQTQYDHNLEIQQTALAAYEKAKLEEAAQRLTTTTSKYAAFETQSQLQQVVRDQYTSTTPEFQELLELISLANNNASTLQLQQASKTLTGSVGQLANKLSQTSTQASAAQDQSVELEKQASDYLEEANTAVKENETILLQLQASKTNLEKTKATLETQIALANTKLAEDKAQTAIMQTTGHNYAQKASLSIEQLNEQQKEKALTPLVHMQKPAVGNVTSPYGMRFHPVLHYTKLHTGTDYAYGDGKVYAAADGVVLETYFNKAYGNLTVIASGTYHGEIVTTWYAHQEVIGVKPGDIVKAGDHIGQIGSTGYSTGPHLHFEIRVGDRYENPEVFLQKFPIN